MLISKTGFETDGLLYPTEMRCPSIGSMVNSFAEYDGAPDDFTFDNAGDAAYLPNAAFDGLVKVNALSGDTEVIVGGTDMSNIGGLTASDFGRTEEGVRKKTL